MINLKYNGRLANHLIIYLMSQYIAEKYNLISQEFPFERYDIRNDFEVNYFCGTVTHSKKIYVSDDNIIDFLNLSKIDGSVFTEKESYFQSEKIFSNEDITNRYLHFLKPIKIDNIDHDLFIHVRLGDVTNIHSLPYDYYEKQIEKIKFNRGAISSDSPNHEIVRNLSKKFNLEVFNNTPEYTIRYASQCKNLVLSAGSFSFMIGFFAKNSKKYFIDNKTMLDKFGIKPWDGGFFGAFLKKESWNNYE